MERRPGRLAAALVATVALLVALPASTASAQSKRACWRAVLGDWADGGIERRHRASCYRAALHNLPNDIRSYTTAEDDIRRALLEEIRDLQPARDTATTAERQLGRANAPSNADAPTRALQGRVPGTAIGDVATPTAATSPPLRAVVAGGLALVLVLLAAVTKLVTHRRAPRGAP